MKARLFTLAAFAALLAIAAVNIPTANATGKERWPKPDRETARATANADAASSSTLRTGAVKSSSWATTSVYAGYCNEGAQGNSGFAGASVTKRAPICDAALGLAYASAACAVDLAARKDETREYCESERADSLRNAVNACNVAEAAIADVHRERRRARVCTEATCFYAHEPEPAACVQARIFEDPDAYPCQLVNMSEAPASCVLAEDLGATVYALAKVPAWKIWLRHNIPFIGSLL